MGMIIRGTGETLPKQVHLILTCDGRHGLFEGERVTQTFADDGYIAQRRACAEAGWVVTGHGRVLCPACAKRPTEAPEPPRTKADMPRLPV